MIRRTHNDRSKGGNSSRGLSRGREGIGTLGEELLKAASRKRVGQEDTTVRDQEHAVNAKKIRPIAPVVDRNAKPQPARQGGPKQPPQVLTPAKASVGGRLTTIGKANAQPQPPHAAKTEQRKPGVLIPRPARNAAALLKAKPMNKAGGKTDAPVKPVPPTQPTRSEVWKRFDGRMSGLAAAVEDRARQAFKALPRPSPQEGELLAERLHQGALSEGAGSGTRSSQGVEIVLGIDFGTTSTKIVARSPYVPGARAVAVPALPFARAEKHAYLWASRLWLPRNGKFSLFPMHRAALVCAIKTNLMVSGSTGGPSLDAGGGVTATADEVATAFLALQILHAKGWLATKGKKLLGKGKPQFSYNLGFPAASLNRSELRACYETCAVAAVELAATTPDVTLEKVRTALAAARIDTSASLERLRVQLHPEIAAAVAGFAKSMRREDGLYAMVDVGGGTVDCCSFNLFSRGDGTVRCPVFLASVERLGVETWKLCEGNVDGEGDFRYLLDTLQRAVIWKTKTSRYTTSPRWITGLPLFLIGGGALSGPHRKSAEELDGWLRKYGRKESGVRIETLPVPENLAHPECAEEQVQRLGVAIGLSWPAVDIPEVELPFQIPDDRRMAVKPIEDQYVGKDQV